MDRVTIKATAKQNMTGNYGSAILGMILHTLLNIGLFFGPFTIGWSKFQKNVYEHNSPSAANVFSGFNIHMWRSILLFFIKVIWTAFLTLLLVVPGILAEYAYSQSFKVMMENPTISPFAAMRQSRQLMKGHKWDYFTLNLSFLGWDILSAMTLGLVSFYSIPYQGQANYVFYASLVQRAAQGSDNPGAAGSVSADPYTPSPAASGTTPVAPEALPKPGTGSATPMPASATRTGPVRTNWKQPAAMIPGAGGQTTFHTKRFCQHCGKAVRSNMKFCPDCGKTLMD